MFWSKKNEIYENLMSSITQLTLIVGHQEKDIEMFREIINIEKTRRLELTNIVGDLQSEIENIRGDMVTHETLKKIMK